MRKRRTGWFLHVVLLRKTTRKNARKAAFLPNFASREKLTHRSPELTKFPMPAARHENKRNPAMPGGGVRGQVHDVFFCHQVRTSAGKPAHTVTELASARQHQKNWPTIMERTVEGERSGRPRGARRQVKCARRSISFIQVALTSPDVSLGPRCARAGGQVIFVESFRNWSNCGFHSE